MHAVITGIGLLTPLGLDPEETWNALLAGESIRAHSPILLPTDPGQVRVNELAVRAAKQAAASAGWSERELGDDGTALVVGTSKGPIENWTSYSPGVAGGCHSAFGLAGTADYLARSLRMGHGPRMTLSAACATGLHAIIRGCLLMQSGAAKRVVVVAAESSLSPLFTGSFKRLGVLSADHRCRPFDEERNGFLMSEGAAAVCLESPAGWDKKSGGLLAVESFALGADATHLTGTDPTGETLGHLLWKVLEDRPVDFVHAHGTGTELNDAVEMRAIESQLKESCLVYSHKAALGHSLGAAGVISVVLNCLVHRYGIIPGNLNTTKPIGSGRCQVSDHAVVKAVQRSLVIAAGFGGAAAVMSFSSICY